MTKELPDKYIRKAISTALTGLIVDAVNVPTYDFRVYNNDNPEAYVLMTTQTNNVIRDNKCGDYWQNNTLLEIVAKKPITSNAGSRLLADNVANEVRDILSTGLLVLDTPDLKIITQSMQFQSDLVTNGIKFTWYRKFLQLTFKII